ncbi:hypothetical protein PQI23_13875 [Leucobacter sp. USCH14]|uniref:hypothetical protein n=1 Tax=Leucobacter sp. USCH14 TaxID=3024838 RepID=UPI0030B00888
MTNQKTPVQGGVPEEQIEAAARALACLEPGADWPTNGELGGSPTGTRDDEYRDGMRNQALAAMEAATAVSASASADPAGEHHDAEEREAESEDHAATATATGDREKLIAEARRWPRAQGVEPSRPPVELINDLADALAAPVEVDAAKLAEVIDAHAHRFYQAVAFGGCYCGWGGSHVKHAEHAAGAVAEWLRGEGQ